MAKSLVYLRLIVLELLLALLPELLNLRLRLVLGLLQAPRLVCGAARECWHYNCSSEWKCLK